MHLKQETERWALAVAFSDIVTCSVTLLTLRSLEHPGRPRSIRESCLGIDMEIRGIAWGRGNKVAPSEGGEH